MVTPRLASSSAIKRRLCTPPLLLYSKIILMRMLIRIPFPAFVTSTYNKLVPEIHVCDAVAADSVGRACADLISKPRGVK